MHIVVGYIANYIVIKLFVLSCEIQQLLQLCSRLVFAKNANCLTAQFHIKCNQHKVQPGSSQGSNPIYAVYYCGQLVNSYVNVKRKFL